MIDQPIAHTTDGRPLYDNTATVVVGLVLSKDGVLTIVRQTEPGIGLISLPGGYHMRGETWQKALAREVLEETGVVVDENTITQFRDVITDEYGNNLIFGVCRAITPLDMSVTDGESTNVMYVRDVGSPMLWAFPLHHDSAEKIVGVLRDLDI